MSKSFVVEVAVAKTCRRRYHHVGCGIVVVHDSCQSVQLKLKITDPNSD